MKVYGLAENEIKEALISGQVTVAVYGLGKMGLPLACVYAQKGAKVVGVDINSAVVAKVNQGICPVEGEPGLPELLKSVVAQKRLSATTDGAAAARESDVLIILVPTLLDQSKNPDLTAIVAAAEVIASGLSCGDFVVLESTVPPRTTRDVLLPILKESGLTEEEFGLAHCPERTMSGRAIKDICGSYPKVMGGVNQRSTATAAAIYSVINQKGVVKVSDATTAEMVKISEGIFRDVNIALANELALACQDMWVNPEEVFHVANEPYDEISGRHHFNFHRPGAGVGGHCIPVYPYFLTKTARTDTSLIEMARRVNEAMPYRVVDLVVEGLNEIKKSVNESKILLLGLAFRGGVKEARYSPALAIIQKLKLLKADVYLYDPLFEPEEIAGTGARSGNGFEGMDCLVIVTDHPEFKDFNWQQIALQMNSKVIVDGRQVVKPEEVKRLGFIYKGIGRL